ncbi:unnamed protein product, partial [Rotaria magnacalcarata]
GDVGGGDRSRTIGGGDCERTCMTGVCFDIVPFDCIVSVVVDSRVGRALVVEGDEDGKGSDLTI